MKKQFFLAASVVGFVALTVAPKEALTAAREALEMCANVIIPTLFPFFVLSSLAVSLGLSDILGKILGVIMKPLFNVSGNCSTAFILGLMSGFPVGAKTAISLYEQGQCSKEEAERILSFSNNAGPAFVLGTVGIGIWNSSSVGWILWLTQVVASVIVGIIFGRLWKGHGSTKVTSTESRKIRVVRFLPELTSAVKNSALNLIYISSFIVFFAVIIKLLTVSGIIPTAAYLLSRIIPSEVITVDDIRNLMFGILEFTTGIESIGNAEPYAHSLTLTSAVLGWAGLSVHCQVLSFIYESGLSPSPYIWGKAMQTVIATVIMIILSKTVNIGDSVSVFAGYAPARNGDITFIIHITALSTLLALLITIIIFIIFLQRNKRSNG